MKVPFVDLKTQYLNYKDEIDRAIQNVIDATAFVRGPFVQKFENDFARFYGAKNCISTANGTDSLYIAMRMFGIGAGDEVITTASTWISTSETITQTGATPVFVDIDEYYTIDTNKIEEKITEKTRAIIPVHLYGQMCDMPAIMALAEKYNLKVIEDCAQSHISELRGIRAGLWGDCGSFSFYPGKNLGAYGDAGCLITNSDDLATDCHRYSNHGALVKHIHDVEGINSRMDGIQAAVLSVKVKYLQAWTDARIKAANLYRKLLSGIEEVHLPPVRPESTHTYHVFGILIEQRDELQQFLRDKEVFTQIHYPTAIPYMPAYRRFGATKADYPEAYKVQKTELSLPIYPEITEEQIEYTCDMIRSFFS